MSVKLLAEHHLVILSLTGGCTCSSESTPDVKMPHSWQSHVTAHYQASLCADLSHSSLNMFSLNQMSMQLDWLYLVISFRN